MEADKLIVACGPWTEKARSWFLFSINLPQITGIQCHSVLVPSPNSVLRQAVFFQSFGLIGNASLESYPQIDGDYYANGFEGEEVAITERPGEESVESEAVVASSCGGNYNFGTWRYRSAHLVSMLLARNTRRFTSYRLVFQIFQGLSSQQVIRPGVSAKELPQARP